MKAISRILVLAVALVVIASQSLASPVLVTQQMSRATYPLGVVAPDSSAFTIEGNSAATITANDTTEAIYVGGLAFWNVPFAATQGVQNLIRFTIQGCPTTLTADTLGLMIDYGMTRTGPWMKSLNGATYDVVLLGSKGAAAADTTGAGYAWNNGFTLTTDANTGYSYTGWLVCSATQTSLANPLGWPYLRARVVGDHGVGLTASVFAAKVWASYYADLVPQVSPRRY